MKMKAIRIENLTKKYGDFTAVNNISFEVEAGSMLGFLGVNGAGKTTTINMISTILTPDAGCANICGYTLGKQDMEIRKAIGVVYQANVLDNLLSVKDNLTLRAKIAGLASARIRSRLVELSALLKLEDILNKKYGILSGGQKRRCEIALALMHSPKILFLDEPTTGLDPATRIDVWNAVGLLRKTEDMTVFLTTHYMEEAANADKLIIIDRGEIKAEGAPFELKDTYAKDSLKLYFPAEREAQIRPAFERSDYKNTAYGARVCLKNSMEAVSLVERVKDLIDGFEVIQGNMDDVFLNVTKEEEETA